MKKLTKTIKLHIHASPEQIELFQQMTEKCRQACNYISTHIFNNQFELNYLRLTKILYGDIRTNFSLKSQMAQSAIKTVIAQYKGVRELYAKAPFVYKNEQGQVERIPKTLEWLQKPIFFARPQVDLVRNRDYSFIDEYSLLSINTLEGRTKCTFDSNPFARYFDGTWTIGTGKLIQLKGLWYFHISVTKDVEDFIPNATKHVVGIDRGMRFLAVTYDEQGKTSFFSGKKIVTKKNKFQKVRRQLQSKGTRSAKRRLKAISGREHRWMSDVNHQISKTLVQKYGKDTLFVIENLDGLTINKRNLKKSPKQNYMLSSWGLYQLEQFLTYKAHENRSEVVKVSAQYTSQRCPKCGAIHKENRNHKNHFYSCQCGYQSNDDRIGAMNIQLLGTMWISGNKAPKFEK